MHGGVTMTGNRSDKTGDPIWDQHVKWLDLVSNECKANQLKREREKASEKSANRNPKDITRPSA